MGGRGFGGKGSIVLFVENRVKGVIFFDCVKERNFFSYFDSLNFKLFFKLFASLVTR